MFPLMWPGRNALPTLTPKKIIFLCAYTKKEKTLPQPCVHEEKLYTETKTKIYFYMCVYENFKNIKIKGLGWPSWGDNRSPSTLRGTRAPLLLSTLGTTAPPREGGTRAPRAERSWPKVWQNHCLNHGRHEREIVHFHKNQNILLHVRIRKKKKEWSW